VNICLFCKNDTLLSVNEQFIFDLNNEGHTIGQCTKCRSLSTLSNEIDKLSEDSILQQQVEIHNQQWINDTEEELNEYLDSLTPLVNYFRETFTLSSGSKVLEVGAGRGGLTRAFLNAGITNIKSCEPSFELYSKAIELYDLSDDNLLNCISSDIFESETDIYDLIIYWHSLEHIPFGLDELKSASQHIGDEGSIVIQVPLLHNPWVYDEHLFFMSEETLVYVEENTSLSVEFVEYDFRNMFMTVAFKNKGSNYTPFRVTTHSLIELYNKAVIAICDDCNVLEKAYGEKLQSNSALEAVIEDKVKSISRYEQLVNEQLCTINSYEGLVNDKLEEINVLNRIIEEKDKKIESLGKK
jgi:2-polyprenyl-3-methyl-5-hydroxy-6-metoxy-1,4-benzoquinol methylase